MDKVPDSILSGKIDCYNFLEISPNSNPNEIRKAYRAKALLYHPDKNPGDEARHNFQILSQAYEILINPDIRKSYDKLRQLNLHQIKQNAKLSEQTRRFKEELQRAERESKSKQSSFSKNLYKNQRIDKTKLDLQKLQEKGMVKIRELENEWRQDQRKDKNPDYVSFRNISRSVEVKNLFSSHNDRDERLVQVKWKFRPEVGKDFGDSILTEIMQIFGPVLSSKVQGHQDGLKYDFGVVEFKNVADATKALSYDYRKSATLWDGTRVRKLASLLRDCTSIDSSQNAYKEESKNITNCSNETHLKPYNTSNSSYIDQVFQHFLQEGSMQRM